MCVCVCVCACMRVCMYVCVCVCVCVCAGCWMEAMSAYESMLNCNVGVEEGRGDSDGDGEQGTE